MPVRRTLAVGQLRATVSPEKARRSAPVGGPMRRLLYLLFLIVFAAAPVYAQQANHPWEADQRLIDDASAAVQRSGILALKPKVAELEQALAGAPNAFELAAKGEGDTHYVLVDGTSDMLGALAGATVSGEKVTTVAVNNPYLMIGFYLGSFYNEIGRHGDAARVLGAALALPENFGLGETRPMLFVERGVALGQLRRWDEALASYDAGLELADDDTVRAYMLRGRGSILIDLNRLDEAEAAFRDSLKLQPDSVVAQHELEYIARLRKGAAPNSPSITKVQPDQ